METMAYTELQKRLTQMKDNGAVLTCSVRSSRKKLEAEYERLLSGTVILPANDPNLQRVDDRETTITVLGVGDDNTIITGIHGEYHIVKVYWDEERDTAISINREIIVSSKEPYWDERKSSDICKIEFLGDGKGSYRAFPMSTVQGYSEWLYPSEDTRYHSVKARLSANDSVSKIINVAKEHQKPTLLTSEDICIVRMVDDARTGITRYFPSIGTFTLNGRRWLLADNNANNVRWISVVQGARQHAFSVGTIVYLQSDIGVKPKLDLYRIDKLFCSHLCLMAHCTNQRTNTTAIVPMVQLHLPQTLR